ncbi:MAG: citrate (Si)-synthase [Chloroflexi bacterium]|nr:citrate (Si)-synthase [Chloroflexota bacterium]
MIIHDEIASQLPAWRERVQRLIRNFGSFKVSEVTVEQIFSGIRGVQIQVSDISYVDPMEGIRIRGYTIPELLERLPRASGSNFPMAGGVFFLLMTDQFPTMNDALEVEAEWRRRSQVPPYIYDLIRAMPSCAHPMTMFSQAILALNCESVFAERYNEGMPKSEYWVATLEDSMNLIGKVPYIASFIYNLRYKDGQQTRPDPDLDWSGNFANMLVPGNREYQDLMRLFIMLHSDHEGANVSAHTSHLVNSALSDIYYSTSAAMNGLAGPLHGLANQECLRWLLNVRDHFGGLPDPEALADYARQTLKSGQVIPGYGHAVLRVTDPRFTAQLDFGNKNFPDDEIFRLAKMVYEVVPQVLMETGKVKNPWPNVDALNGTMQHHYGVTEFDFYTVLFGSSRILGLTSHAVWARALGKPIERPKSLTTAMLEEMIESARVKE